MAQKTCIRQYIPRELHDTSIYFILQGNMICRKICLRTTLIIWRTKCLYFSQSKI